MRQQVDIDAIRGVNVTLDDLGRLSAHIGDDGIAADVAVTAAAMQRIASLIAEFDGLPVLSAAHAETVADAERSDGARAQWEAEWGRPVRAAIEEARRLVGGPGTDPETDPATSYEECIEHLGTAIEQAQSHLANDDALAQQASQLGASLDNDRSSLAALEGESAELTRDWDGLIEVLAGLIPHIDGDDCPVCGRDYGELQLDPSMIMSRRSSRTTPGSQPGFGPSRLNDQACKLDREHDGAAERHRAAQDFCGGHKRHPLAARRDAGRAGDIGRVRGDGHSGLGCACRGGAARTAGTRSRIGDRSGSRRPVTPLLGADGPWGRSR